MNKDLYTVIEDTGTYIMCHGVYKYHEAIGHLVAKAKDANDLWIDNDYTLESSDEFFLLEADTGFGWFYDFKDKNGYKLYERWYLLKVENDEGE